MALRDFVRSGAPTPATVATVATVEGEQGRSVARVASVAEGEGPDSTPFAGSEQRSQRVHAMLAERPGRRYAVVTDDADAAYPGCVVLGIGLRLDDGSIATCDIITPAERFDGLALLALIERHSAEDGRC